MKISTKIDEISINRYKKKKRSNIGQYPYFLGKKEECRSIFFAYKINVFDLYIHK